LLSPWWWISVAKLPAFRGRALRAILRPVAWLPTVVAIPKPATTTSVVWCASTRRHVLPALVSIVSSPATWCVRALSISTPLARPVLRLRVVGPASELAHHVLAASRMRSRLILTSVQTVRRLRDGKVLGLRRVVQAHVSVLDATLWADGAADSSLVLEVIGVVVRAVLPRLISPLHREGCQLVTGTVFGFAGYFDPVVYRKFAIGCSRQLREGQPPASVSLILGGFKRSALPI
jgi:hypothetical protein